MAELLTRMCHILKSSFTHGTFQPHPWPLNLEAPPSSAQGPHVLELRVHCPFLTLWDTILLRLPGFSLHDWAAVAGVGGSDAECAKNGLLWGEEQGALC